MLKAFAHIKIVVESDSFLILHHTCATWSELQSYISTIVWTKTNSQWTHGLFITAFLIKKYACKVKWVFRSLQGFCWAMSHQRFILTKWPVCVFFISGQLDSWYSYGIIKRFCFSPQEKKPLFHFTRTHRFIRNHLI